MRRMYFAMVIIAALLLIMPEHSFAASGTAARGTTTAQFLKLPVGARSIAMGEAFTAACEDASALYWNPGSIGLLRRKEFSFSHSEWIAGIRYEYASYVQPIRGVGNFGVSIRYLNVGDGLVYYDRNGVGGDDQFGASDLAVSVAYGKNIMSNIYLGANLKYISSSIAPGKDYGKSAQTFAVDLGLYIKAPVEQNKLSFGVAIRDIGPDMTYLTTPAPLPRTIVFGTAYKMFNENMTVAFDIVLPNDNEISYHLGYEYWLTKLFAVRVGYTTGRNDLGGAVGLAAGLGANWLGWSLDYAWQPFGVLAESGVHRVSLSTRF